MPRSAAPDTTPPRLVIVGCGAIARELLALTANVPGVRVEAVDARLHMRPQLIADGVARKVDLVRERYGRDVRIFVAYADCGTGGLLAARCAALGVEMIAGPHCYSFFDGNAAFAERSEAEVTVFYLTDFLVRQFDAFVWRPMGLDRHPELRDMLFGNYERLVYLAQVDDADLDAEAARCAARLGLAYERRVTGYGDLATALDRL